MKDYHCRCCGQIPPIQELFAYGGCCEACAMEFCCSPRQPFADIIVTEQGLERWQKQEKRDKERYRYA